MPGSRWEALFADLAAEADAEGEAERRSEVADRTRAEFARLRLIDRLRPLLEGPGDVRIGLAGHQPASGSVDALGIDWVLLAGEAGGELLVALSAVQWVQGLKGRSAEPGWEGAVGARLGLRVALRRIVRDRSAVSVGLTGGDTLGGRLARVGADQVELEPVREIGGLEPAAGQRSTIPLSSIAFVRRR